MGLSPVRKAIVIIPKGKSGPISLVLLESVRRQRKNWDSMDWKASLMKNLPAARVIWKRKETPVAVGLPSEK